METKKDFEKENKKRLETTFTQIKENKKRETAFTQIKEKKEIRDRLHTNKRKQNKN